MFLLQGTYSADLADFRRTANEAAILLIPCQFSYIIACKEIKYEVQIANSKMELELVDTIKFAKTFEKGIDELKLNLNDSNNLSKSDILINNIDTHECIVGRLYDLKYGDKTRNLEISEAYYDFKHAILLRKTSK